MSIRSFLQVVKHELQNKPLKFVSGNQSADLDSVLSAIGYSYLNYKYDASITIPLINIPRQDFNLRRDIKLVLENHSITEDLLYFIEDYTSLTSNATMVDLSLVDHCNLQGETLIDSYRNGKLKVTSIIDHHADEGVFLDANPRIITPSGSCSSLVFNHWHSKIQSETDLAEVAKLFIAPLLIDTSNMTDKVETSDVEAFKLYKQILEPSIEFHTFDMYFTNFYKSVKKAKKDLDGFKVQEVLRKDYKQFEFGGVNVGFSSIGKSSEWVFKKYSKDEIIAGIADVTNFYRLDVLIITPLYTDKTDAYRREFMIAYGKDNKFPILDILEKECVALQLDDKVYKKEDFSDKLEQINGTIFMRVSNQANLAASRKQIVPVVKDVLQK